MATALVADGRHGTAGLEAADDSRFMTRTFWLFVLAHVTVWTLLPILTQPNIPLDVVESLYFGHEWQLGYHKHPPLPSWIAEATSVVTGGSLQAIYLISQVAVAICFWAAWRLGREMLAPRTALLAVCLLECCWYYNYRSTEFNNNVGMYPFWVLAILFLYWALEKGQNRYWIATGASLGLGLLAKYSTGMLVLTMVGFMFFNGRARRAWLRFGPYLTTLVAFLVFSPHLYWAITHRFSTIDFALARRQSGGRLVDHLLCPLDFGVSQLAVLLPMIIVIGPLTGYRWRLRKIEPKKRFQRDFLVVMALGPFLLQLIVSGLLNVSLRGADGQQLWPLAGLLMLFCLQGRPGPSGWRKVLIGCVTMGVLFGAATVIHNVAGPYVRSKTSRIHFPGRSLAARVEQMWGQRYDQPLTLVAGQWWVAGNVAAYSPNRPSVYGGSDPDKLDMAPLYSEWTSDQDLERRGGVILWDTRHLPGVLPPQLQERFPTVEALPPITISWQTGAEVPPLRIGVAIVPPGSPDHETGPK